MLSATPYMGWDTYFALPGCFSESTILQEANLLKTTGLEADGYRLIWLDSSWWQGQRNAAGAMVVSRKQWPHGIAWLASTLHANGFELGVYTDAGSTGCGVKGGAYGHYQQDINTLAAWGVDAVKVDWCGGSSQGLIPAQAYAAVHQAILDNASHRPMLLDICNFLQPGQKSANVPVFQQSAFFSYSFGPSDGTSWRTDTDVGVPGNVPFSSVLRNLDADAHRAAGRRPGPLERPRLPRAGRGHERRPVPDPVQHVGDARGAADAQRRHAHDQQGEPRRGRQQAGDRDRPGSSRRPGRRGLGRGRQARSGRSRC